MLVVNMCGFIDHAKRESLDTIPELTRLTLGRRVRGVRCVVVLDCQPTRVYPEFICPPLDTLQGLGRGYSFLGA